MACGFWGEFGAFWVRNLGFLGSEIGVFFVANEVA